MRVRVCVGRYMFAQDPLKGLREDYGAPNFFADRSRYGYSREERAETALFYVGPAGSGVNFHQHTNAWNALFYGRKRWFLFPPYTIFGPTALPMKEWHRTFYPQLKDVAVECVQEAGEMLYAPTNWYHGILNLEPSVGIAVEIGANEQLLERLLGQ